MKQIIQTDVALDTSDFQIDDSRLVSSNKNLKRNLEKEQIANKQAQ